ncbi:MAG: transposase, partial [Candidatus Binatia bacterium]
LHQCSVILPPVAETIPCFGFLVFHIPRLPANRLRDYFCNKAERNREHIHAAITAKIKELKGTLHALNSMADHVHLVVTVPPSLSLAMFVGQVKGSSSHRAARLSSESTLFAWQAEYGVISVSELHLPAVMRYVRLQQQHHAKSTLNQRLETCE